MNELSLVRLSPELIEFNDYSLCLSPLEKISPHDDLLKSIQKFGILSPPLVRMSGKKYIIVSGRKRLLAGVTTKGSSSIPCLVIQENASAKNVFTTLLEHANMSTPLSVIEQAIFFRKALSFMSKQEAEHFLPTMGYKKQKYQIYKLLNLLSLEKIVQTAVHCGTITLKTALKLAPLSSTNQNYLVEIITGLHLGGSKQNKLVTLSIELLMRENKSIEQIFNENDLAFNGQSKDNIPQKTSRLLQLLADQCFPRLKTAEKKFHSFKTNLQLPQRAKLDHTSSFEDNGLTLTISFQNDAQFKEEWPEIKKIIK